MKLHISIAGAGLGGLCLAQALRRIGIDFDVYERDSALASRAQGYRIRIDGKGQRALAHCLPASLYTLFRQWSIVSDCVRLIDSDLSSVGGRAPSNWRADSPALDSPDTPPDLCVHRQTLREILLCGIEDRVHFGAAVRGFQVLADNGVQIAFANGASRSSTLLVGADGVHSAVRAQLLPEASSEETDAVCIYGKTVATGELRSRLRESLVGGTSVIFANGFATIVDPMVFRDMPLDLLTGQAPMCRLERVDDYIYWAFIGARERLVAGAWPGQQELPALVGALVQPWHPQLRELFLPAAGTMMTIVPVHSAAAEIAFWTPGPVTLLGDAIHPMSPAAGAGANTALHDAATLACAISNSTDLLTAVAAYEPDMRAHASTAVRASIEAAARLCGPVASREND